MLVVGVLVGVASACGGTVCNGGTTTTGTTSTGGGPIVQSGERIVFLQEADEWTAFVQIQTAGAPTDFGWVVPLPNDIDPDEVTLAPAGMMDDLEEATAPQFVTDNGTSSGANTPADASACSSGCGGIPSLGDLLTVGAGQLLGSAVVGPYEIATVGRDDPEALAAWFLEGGYNLPITTWPLLDDYIANDYSFLVIRLLPTEEAQGTVETLRIPCGQAVPAIPLKLTSIAAVPDMGITTWIVSNRRYEPANDWPEVGFDPATVNPGNAPIDYGQQLRAALDGGGGQGFRTEFAGRLDALDLDAETLDAIGASGGYVTRLQTWASPEEMLSDPEFLPAADGSDVDNVIDLRSSGAAGLGLLAPVLLGLVGIARRRRSRG